MEFLSLSCRRSSARNVPSSAAKSEEKRMFSQAASSRKDVVVLGQCSVKWFDVLSVPKTTDWSDTLCEYQASGKGLLLELQEDIYLLSGFLIKIEGLYLVNYYIRYIIIPNFHCRFSQFGHVSNTGLCRREWNDVYSTLGIWFIFYQVGKLVESELGAQKCGFKGG